MMMIGHSLLLVDLSLTSALPLSPSGSALPHLLILTSSIHNFIRICSRNTDHTPVSFRQYSWTDIAILRIESRLPLGDHPHPQGHRQQGHSRHHRPQQRNHTHQHSSGVASPTPVMAARPARSSAMDTSRAASACADSALTPATTLRSVDLGVSKGANSSRSR